MSDDGEPVAELGIATTRSRRDRGAKKASRMQELSDLKASRQAGKRQLDEVEEIKNVYDVVDVDDYSELVSKRQNDDWIVDDGDGYVEDGREIFDEEMGDEMEGHRSTTSKSEKSKNKKAKFRKKADANATTEESSSSSAGKSIKNMILNMGTLVKRKSKEEANLQDDAVLGELLGEIKATSKSSSDFGKAKLKTPIGGGQQQKSKSHSNPFAVRPAATGIKRPAKKPLATQNPEQDHQGVGALSQMIEDDDDFGQDMFDEPMEADDDDEPAPSQMIDECEPTVKAEEQKENTVVEAKSSHRGFQSVKKDESKMTINAGWSIKSDSTAATVATMDVQVDPGTLPLITNAKGEKVLRMYWLDAHEDLYKHPGTVWLFGKVYIEKAKAFVSCCVTIKNIDRQVFLLCREKKFDMRSNKSTDEECGIGDVYEEFNSKVTQRFKISEFKSKPATLSYAFEHQDVPSVGTYLQILYSSKCPALPTDLKGETFSRVFGANQSSLERFLLDRRIKGPSWIDIKMVSPSEPPSSWCKLEANCDNPGYISVVTSSPPPAPPVTILALNMKTVINPKTHQNEIALVSGLVHNKFHLDRPAPQPPYVEHFCALTRPSDEVWPFDFQKVLAQNNSTSGKIDKMDSERALLGFLLAKIGKIDPDIIIGHDIFGFDMEILVHRTVQNKIPNWSRLGRLKRSQPPMGKGRFNERQAVTGRLLCDLKISAKELIRCKSYDLGPLIEKLLGKSLENRLEVDIDSMRKAYGASKSLLEMTSLSLQDAADTLQCICELNALPLALQITQVAGNVMSRTLLGGRAERNDFLLLHAFHEKDYIVPDKQPYGKNKTKAVQDDGNDIADASVDTKTGQGKRKPAYAGGLVLEPKKGFYDTFILLMDFNSLYPSIIQEYNICFTTVNRQKPPGIKEEDYIPELPEAGSEAGVLPTEIKKLVESRRAVKKLLANPDISEDQRLQYDIRQKALKLTANSMYGCLGFSFSRFYAKPLAALVTSRGREILLQTKDLVEKMNLEVIYGDTDSIMINSNSVDYDEVYKLGAQIKIAINKTYRLLELDVDGVYRYMLLLKKKKYAAVTMERKPNGKLVTTTELKGLDIVRRDWCQLAANTGKDILGKILSDCAADERVSYLHQTLENIAKELKDGKISLADLSITKSLTKDPQDYPDKKSLPHVQVALRVNSKGGKKLRAGDTVQYVICDDGSQLAATQRAFHIDEVKENEALKVDIQYYLAHQLHPVVSRLCDPLDGTDSSRIAQCLGLDPEQYRRAIRAESHHDDEVNVKDEDRFRQCEKLTIECDCGEQIVLDGVTVGSGKDAKLALMECPQPKCQKCPILDKSAYIKNKLTLAIRSHIQKYYAGWIICEDPGCSGRTRRVPLAFQRAFPVCSTCFKATMYREYTDSQLYTQLLFFQNLFSLSKFNDAYPKAVEQWRLSNSHFVDEVLTRYNDLFNTAKKTMLTNKYCMVSLNKVFEGLFPITVEDRFKKP